MLEKRIFSSIIISVIAIIAVIFRPILILVVSVLILLGMLEFFTMVENKGLKLYKYVGSLIGLIIPFSIGFGFELTRRWEFLFIVLLLVILFLMQFRRRDNSGVVIDIAVTIFAILYISWLFSFVIKLRFIFNGPLLIAALILITKSGDIGAYFVGRKFGKRPLIARISPNKTVEGAIGGFIFSTIAALISGFFLKLNFGQSLLLGCLLGVIAQFGDLCESLIKRDCGVKDSSSLFPGLGGVLDVIDSLLFTAPVFYFYITAIY